MSLLRSVSGFIYINNGVLGSEVQSYGLRVAGCPSTSLRVTRVAGYVGLDFSGTSTRTTRTMILSALLVLVLVLVLVLGCSPMLHNAITVECLCPEAKAGSQGPAASSQ